MSNFLVSKLSSFQRDERGSLIVFTLFLIILVLIMGGMAVDTMRHETRLVALQNTLDSAVIAAASSRQKLDREEVIKDFMSKAGLDPDQVSISTSDVNGETRATVSASYATNTMFMNLLGIDSLKGATGSEAYEKITKIEISLVLDFTSSMKAQGRRAALVDSVDDFINVVYELDCSTGTCIAPEDAGDITVNIVPYGGTVNPGPVMAEMMGLSRWHGYSSCGLIPDAAYDEIGLPYGSVQQYPHFYSWHRANLGQNQEFGWCPQDNNTILYASNDPNAIKTYVRGLNLNDGTGSDIGMKWGVSLLDPSSRDEINTLVSEGIVTGNTSGAFPEDYDDNILKIVVLMTDGGITFQAQPIDFDFDWIYHPDVVAERPLDVSDDDYSYEWLYDETIADVFLKERLDALERYGSLEVSEDALNALADGDDIASLGVNGGSALELDEDGDLIYRPRADIEFAVPNDERVAGRSNGPVTRNEAIENLEAQCGIAKAARPNGVDEKMRVYTVRLLETAQWTEDYMKPCASDDLKYFDVNSVEDLDDAFVSIARHINNSRLRLTN